MLFLNPCVLSYNLSHASLIRRLFIWVFCWFMVGTGANYGTGFEDSLMAISFEDSLIAVGIMYLLIFLGLGVCFFVLRRRGGIS